MLLRLFKLDDHSILKNFLSPYFPILLWVPLCAETIRGVVSNQVNTVHAVHQKLVNNSDVEICQKMADRYSSTTAIKAIHCMIPSVNSVESQDIKYWYPFEMFWNNWIPYQ